MLSIFWTLAGLRPDFVFGEPVAKEADFGLFDVTLAQVEHCPVSFALGRIAFIFRSCSALSLPWTQTLFVIPNTREYPLRVRPFWLGRCFETHEVQTTVGSSNIDRTGS